MTEEPGDAVRDVASASRPCWNDRFQMSAQPVDATQASKYRPTDTRRRLMSPTSANDGVACSALPRTIRPLRQHALASVAAKIGFHQRSGHTRERYEASARYGVIR